MNEALSASIGRKRQINKNTANNRVSERCYATTNYCPLNFTPEVSTCNLKPLCAPPAVHIPAVVVWNDDELA